MLRDYAGRPAFITGGASGIGLGMAEAFVARGLPVVLADIDAERAEAEARRLCEAGHRACGLSLDVRDDAAWTAALDMAEAEFGPIAIICANAGVTGNVRPIAQSEYEGWRFTLEINLHGCFLAARIGLPRLLSQDRPCHFVATSSAGAFFPFATNGAYSASKAGINALCETLADELKDSHVGVSVFCPGLVESRLHETSRALGPEGLDLGQHRNPSAGSVKAMIGARDAGEIVAKGIDQGRFWLFSSERTLSYVEDRLDRMILDHEALFGPR